MFDEYPFLHWLVQIQFFLGPSLSSSNLGGLDLTTELSVMYEPDNTHWFKSWHVAHGGSVRGRFRTFVETLRKEIFPPPAPADMYKVGEMKKRRKGKTSAEKEIKMLH